VRQGYTYSQYRGSAPPFRGGNHAGPANARGPAVDHWRDSNDYRAQYFEKNRGLMGLLYICSQCGRPMSRNSKHLQVDHILAPSRFAKKRTTFFGKVKNTSMASRFLNSGFNCVAICRDCNQRKSNRMGLFVARGLAAKGLEVTARLAATAVVASVGIALFTARFGLRTIGRLFGLGRGGRRMRPHRMGFRRRRF
jgi:hypothetical protein